MEGAVEVAEEDDEEAHIAWIATFVGGEGRREGSEGEERTGMAGV